MMALPANTRIWIAAGVTDLRRGFTGLSALVERRVAHSIVYDNQDQKPHSISPKCGEIEWGTRQKRIRSFRELSLLFGRVRNWESR